MPIPTVMLNDDIKAFVAYAEYLTKSSGTQPASGKGKGLITMKDFEVALKNIGVPRKKWSETVFEESAQSEGVEADTMNSEETKKEDEIPLVQIQTGVIIGRQVYQESDKEALNYSKKLKRVERMLEAAEFLLQLRKAKKASKQEFILQQQLRGSGSGVTPAVPDEPSGSSSSSSLDFDDEIKDITYDDENDRATDKEKAEAKKAEEEHTGEYHTMTEQARIEQPENVQAKESVPEPQVEQHAVPHPSSSQTLSSAEYGNQFINDNPEVSLTDILKEPKVEVQSLLDVLIL
ncbi:hypothetical protein Tco_0762751 [Tanacetum coccineum]